MKIEIAIRNQKVTNQQDKIQVRVDQSVLTYQKIHRLILAHQSWKVSRVIPAWIPKLTMTAEVRQPKMPSGSYGTLVLQICKVQDKAGFSLSSDFNRQSYTLDIDQLTVPIVSCVGSVGREVIPSPEVHSSNPISELIEQFSTNCILEKTKTKPRDRKWLILKITLGATSSRGGFIHQILFQNVSTSLQLFNYGWIISFQQTIGLWTGKQLDLLGCRPVVDVAVAKDEPVDVTGSPAGAV